MDEALKGIKGMKIMMVESIINYKFPEDFKNYYKNIDNLNIDKEIIINNEKYNITSLLSFDSEDKLYIIKYLNFNSEYSKVLIPFAILSSTDTLCFDRNTNIVFLYKTDEDKIIKVSDKFSDIFKSGE